MQCVELYWPNKKPKRKCSFKDGKRSGEDKIWSSEGILIDCGSYEQGNPVGTHRRWNEKGTLLEEVTYLDASRFNFKAWDEDGELRFESTWLNKTCYIEKLWDRFEKKWKEKQGTWKKGRLVFETKTERITETSLPKMEGEGSLSILHKKAPHLCLLVPSWESIKAPIEALKSFDLGHAQNIYVYGLGGALPYFQLKQWLHKNPKRKVIFLEDNEGHFAHFLTTPHSKQILEDPQVHLEHVLDPDLLAQQFPVGRIEMVALPSKQGARFSKFKMELFRKSTLTHALHQDRLHGYQPFSNFVQNISQVPNSFYVNRLKNAFEGMPAIVCGAGPSLKQAIPRLKKLSKKALIIAGGSTLAALSAEGVPIHFGVAIDPNLEEYRRFKNSFAFDTPLIYSTRVHPGVFQTSNGPFGYMRSGIGGVLELWVEEELGLTDSFVGENLSHESIAVTPIATALAAFFGCKTILFSGVDLAYVGKKHYAKGVSQDEEIIFSDLDIQKSAADRILLRKNGNGKKVHTATRWVMEAASLGFFCKKHKEIEFFNTSAEGLPIRNTTYRSFDEFAFKTLPNLEKTVQSKIAQARFPEKTEQTISEKMEELKQSLNAVVKYLEILVGEVKGSAVLAEIELAEELAYDLLFYDHNEILEKGNWKQFLELAREYQSKLS